MGFSSITKRLIFLVIAFFLMTMMILFAASEIQLRKIIDSGQHLIYQEKIEIVLNELERTNTRLQKTGLVDAYIDDFQNTILRELKNGYYEKGMTVFPFLLDKDGKILIHPYLERGASSMDRGLFPPESLSEDSGEFLTEEDGQTFWNLYKAYEPWGWIVCFSVPYELKYANLIDFRIHLLEIMVVCSILILTVLSIVLVNLNRPIVKLTEVSMKIAEGHLDQKIEISGKDEVSILAQSFNHMQASIKKKIEDLNLEITERLRAEKELSSARNYISSIINSMPSILIGLDDDGKVTQWNAWTEKVTGISVRDALGRDLEGLHPLLSVDSESIRRAVRDGKIVHEAARKRVIGDRIRFDDITIYPLRTNGAAGAVLRIDDVTDQNHMKEQLAQSQKMDAIGQLAGGVAHDFNNMLMGITSAAQLLKTIEEEKGGESGNALAYINIIQEAAKRSADLTAKLLTFGRKTTLTMTPVDLHQVINESIGLLERTLDRKVSIKINPEAENFVFSGEFTSIQNALINLGINAAQAMPEGGELTISTKNKVLDEYYCSYSPFDIHPGLYIDLSVEDTGSGIPLGIIDKIFDPFFTTKEHGRGTGLGLSSVYGIVQGHNGAVTVYSEEGSGTVFHLYLPCAEQVSAGVQEDAGPLNGSGVILLVDDEEIIRLTSKPMLESLGYTVLLAGDGEEGLEVFKKEAARIDLVITDMIMPRMNGRELILRIRETGSECPVVISSGFTKDEDLNSLKKNGLSGYIQKPFTREGIARLLSSLG